MNNHHKRFTSIFLFAVFFTAGCASQSGWQTEKAPPEFVDGTRVLGEAILVTTREQALANQGLMKGWRDKLLAAGYSDTDIVGGSAVTVWAYCYGWNSDVPLCAHHGHYVAQIPAALQGQVRYNDDGDAETAGDLLEIELMKTPSGQLVGKVASIYRKFDDWGPCRQARLQRQSALATLAGVGPPRGSWIECENVETDGWQRRAVPGTPVTGGLPISEWVKLPK